MYYYAGETFKDDITITDNMKFKNCVFYGNIIIRDGVASFQACDIGKIKVLTPDCTIRFSTVDTLICYKDINASNCNIANCTASLGTYEACNIKKFECTGIFEITDNTIIVHNENINK